MANPTAASNADPNLDDSFVMDDSDQTEEDEFERSEMDIDAQFLRKQRISCFAHNMMLAVKKVTNHFLVLSAALSQFLLSGSRSRPRSQERERDCGRTRRPNRQKPKGSGSSKREIARRLDKAGSYEVDLLVLCFRSSDSSEKVTCKSCMSFIPDNYLIILLF